MRDNALETFFDSARCLIDSLSALQLFFIITVLIGVKRTHLIRSTIFTLVRIAQATAGAGNTTVAPAGACFYTTTATLATC